MPGSPFSLKGKIAVITGSSRGIGRAVAETMAALGANVVISSRKGEACETVAAAIRANGGNAIVIPCNISRKNEVEELIAGTEKTFGAPDILVCNAAVNPSYGPLADLADEAFDKIMSSNVKSNLWLCNRVIPAMREKGGGAIVIISSIAGLRGNSVIGAYENLQGGRFCPGAQSRRRARSRQHPRQLHRARPGEDRFCPRAMGRHRELGKEASIYAVAAHRHAGRNRPDRRLSRVACGELHYRPGHRCRRRRHDLLRNQWPHVRPVRRQCR